MSSNPTTLQDVSNVIDNLVAQKVLSLDGLEGIQKLKARADTADKEIEKLRTQLDESNAANGKLAFDLSKATEQLAEIAAREKAVAKREVEIHKLEMQAAVASAESKAFRHALGVVFAPNTVREAVQKYGSVAGQNGLTYPTNDSGTIQTTQGYLPPDQPAGERSNLG